MAKPKEGVSDRILCCAKEEFLKKGYMDASLRVIAAKAGTTTGSIYTRFGDKEGLFSAIVEPAADGMMERFLKIQESFHEFEPQVQHEQMGRYTSDEMEGLLDYMYDHFEEFSLLLDAAYGTKFQSFLDKLVDIEVDYTYKYMEATGCESVVSGVVTEEVIHLVVTTYFNGVFEVIRRRMSREDARKYIHILQKYHLAGFDTILSPEP